MLAGVPLRHNHVATSRHRHTRWPETRATVRLIMTVQHSSTLVMHVSLEMNVHSR